MKFYDRTEEIATLHKIRENAKDNAQFTVVTGRRRIGKTSLVLKAYIDTPILYFFVGRKAENLLERYFYAKAVECGNYTMLGRWWDRKGKNEIDLIAANEIDKTADVYETNRQRKNINITALDEKVRTALLQIPKLKGCAVEIRGIDMENM